MFPGQLAFLLWQHCGIYWLRASLYVGILALSLSKFSLLWPWTTCLVPVSLFVKWNGTCFIRWWSQLVLARKSLDTEGAPRLLATGIFIAAVKEHSSHVALGLGFCDGETGAQKAKWTSSSSCSCRAGARPQGIGFFWVTSLESIGGLEFPVLVWARWQSLWKFLLVWASSVFILCSRVVFHFLCVFQWWRHLGRDVLHGWLIGLNW